MEDEIDLRPYIDSLRRAWYLILSVAFGFGALAFLVSSLLTPVYQATALIFVRSSDIVQFDERFQTPNENQFLKNLPELATSDNILQIVLTQLTLDNIKHAQQLRQRLNVTTGSDASLINLEVIYTDPALAADIALVWANTFVEQANEIFSDYDGGQLEFYENQLREAEAKLLSAEEALITFESENRSQVISNTLQAYSQRQKDFLETQADLNLLKQDSQVLLNTFTVNSSAETLSLSEQLMSLTLQLRLVNSESTTPLLIEPTESLSLTSESKAQQIQLLENMLAILDTQSQIVSEELIKIEPLILDLQQQLQIASTEYARLSRELTLAEGTYNALALKVEEENITSQNTDVGITLASKPILPNKPIGPNKVSYAIVGFLLGAVVAIFVVLSKQWWRIYNQS